ncbi:MAG: phosphatidylglycerol:prolipoprotein diacylglycerol transferase [Parasphingorhabdus sp.]|jgi:phosphatidylglycerol:prolipoprotein diacylglycerol transferase
MLFAPEIDPILISIGPLAIRWYGLMYLVGFLGGALLGVHRTGKPNSGWQSHEVWDLLFYIALGAVIGGRLGYTLFYQFGYFVSRPWEIFYVWAGGMSFHGGVIGVSVAIYLFSRRYQRNMIAIADFAVPLMPLGLFAGRIGNFINQELWGRPSDVPWAMVFSTADNLPRHPSQLYEAALEGLVLFILLWLYSSRKRALGRVSGLFLCGYAMARFVVEFFREPDLHLGTIAFNWMTMGQLLCIPMLLVGSWLLFRKVN